VAAKSDANGRDFDDFADCKEKACRVNEIDFTYSPYEHEQSECVV
jgi:hypothetical protein